MAERLELAMLLGFHLTEQVQPIFVEPIDCDLNGLIESWFSSQEQIKLNQLSDQKRANRIIGHVAAKKTLAQLLAVSPRDITIDHYLSGTPFAQVNGTSYPVSISHIRGYGAALTTAMSERHIGIDIAHDRGHVTADLVARVVTLREREWLSDNEMRQRFIELWVLKEAALKAWGVGMRVAPWEVEVDFQKENGITITSATMDYPKLCGNIVHGRSENMVLGMVWSNESDQRVWKAYYQPPGRHIGY